MADKTIDQLSGITNPSYTGNTIYDDGDVTYRLSLENLKKKFVSDGMSITGSLLVSGSSIIGKGTLHTGNPEILHVENSGSYNIVHIQGDHDLYTQINLKNINSGSSASGDIVITADNGTENIHYVDLGINSSTYNAGYVGRENDAYLINSGKDLYLGTIGDFFHPSNLHLFTRNRWTNPQISISGSKQIAFNKTSVSSGYTYEFSGSMLLDHELRVSGHTTMGSVSVSGDLSMLNGTLTVNSLSETFSSITGATNMIAHSLNSGNLFHHSNVQSDLQINFTDVPESNGTAVGFTIVINQGSTDYTIDQVMVNDVAVYVNWVNGSTPSTTPNNIDVFGFSLLRINNGWTVLGTLSKFN